MEDTSSTNNLQSSEPQDLLQTAINTENTPVEPQKKSKRTLFLAIVLILGIVGGSLLAFYLTQKPDLDAKPQTETQQPQASQTPDSSAQTDALGEQLQPATATNVLWAYLKNDNIYIYDTDKQTETALTTDANSTQIWYRNPQVINKNLVSYSRCQRSGDTNQDPYTCTIRLHNLSDDEATDVISRNSKANINGYHSGAEFLSFSWNLDATKLAYTATDLTETNSEATQENVYLYTPSSNTNTTLLSLPPALGRGGSLNDDASLQFSPDSNHLIANATFVFPNQENGTSLYIYNLTTNPPTQVHTSLQSSWGTFGRWINSQTAIYKQIDTASSNADLIAFDTQSQATETLSSGANGWYDFQPLGSGALSYYTLNPTENTGFTLYRFNPQTKTSSEITTNLFAISQNAQQIAVRTTQPCSNDDNAENPCGMNYLNGRTHGGFGVFDTQSNAITLLPIQGNGNIFDISAKFVE